MTLEKTKTQTLCVICQAIQEGDNYSNQIVRKTGYTYQTIHKIVKEMENEGIIHLEKKGRKNRIIINNEVFFQAVNKINEVLECENKLT